MTKPEETLTADVVFERLERLREVLRLVDYLREFRPVRARDPELATVSPERGTPQRGTPERGDDGR